jgi:hypothetical protein
MRYLVKLRYYPGDPLREIRQADLAEIAQGSGLAIAMEAVGQEEPAGVYEKTLDRPLEEITQTVITVQGDDEPTLRKGLREVFAAYRAPRTVFALWGSDPAGMAIARETIEEMDGWW